VNIPGYSEFVERSKDRERQRKIVRELFQSKQMSPSIFKHLSRLIDAAQRRDERETGYKFTNVYDGSKASGLKSSPTFLVAQ
jgi:hypothetical protein